MDHFELVCNGEVVGALELDGARDFSTLQDAISLDRVDVSSARGKMDSSTAILDFYPTPRRIPDLVETVLLPIRPPGQEKFPLGRDSPGGQVEHVYYAFSMFLLRLVATGRALFLML